MMRYTILAIAVLLTIGAGIAVADVGDDGTVINACAKGSNGQLRIVDGPEDCKKSEYPVAWNAAGVDGADGTNGVDGADGIQGEPGVADFYTRAQTGSVDPGQTRTIGYSCVAGDEANGGGYAYSSTSFSSLIVSESRPHGDLSWVVTAYNPSSNTVQLTTYVRCADLTP